jgi:hypothetical protein
MTALEILLEALKVYEIKIVSVSSNHIKVQGNYEVEVEANGLYKLLDDGYIIAPFDDVNELCKFILT